MSGGVDSSVVAKLLSEKDYDLSAVFMRNWDTRDESGTDSGCEWKKDWEDVQRVCRYLDIPCRMIDLSRQYWTRVFEPALQMWEDGYTPNPDVWCNKEVKFGALIDNLTENDSWLATGHYADKSWSPMPNIFSSLLGKSATPRPQLRRPKDRTKDQTYYLAAVPEASLARAIFPLARYSKPEVRELARKWGLPTAQREESMGICFVGEKRRFNEFLSQYIEPKPGPIIDMTTGETIGIHKGLWTLTIGQNARIKGMPAKTFVKSKHPETNSIFVVPGSNNPLLSDKALIAANWQWIWRDSPPLGVYTKEGFRCRLQYISRMIDVPCTIRQEHAGGNSMLITLDEPQKGITPGQVAVIWDGDWCLGCGIIKCSTHDFASQI
ncbi:5-methylaminomethyl-2-thiouridylate-methyltransferase [Wolfiporia cocos MD-104 SS10]|uniref:tRNA-5-taurinomethyluridine 2-sulfurtransferase n=1 Tax=Wolfiporia cocos (strain MD-104) TaxID=742152 RepID=A0A2H3J6U7_WOLCO|nr:5-methylaminomethyl-2-thiouridylate-methyltransferase [Wolfiporia cocos MD-104 SS10]